METTFEAKYTPKFYTAGRAMNLQHLYSILPRRIGCIDTLSLRVQTCKGNHSLNENLVYFPLCRESHEHLGTNNHCLQTFSPRKRKLMHLKLHCFGVNCLYIRFNITLPYHCSYTCAFTRGFFLTVLIGCFSYLSYMHISSSAPSFFYFNNIKFRDPCKLWTSSWHNILYSAFISYFQNQIFLLSYISEISSIYILLIARYHVPRAPISYSLQILLFLHHAPGIYQPLGVRQVPSISTVISWVMASCLVKLLPTVCRNVPFPSSELKWYESSSHNIGHVMQRKWY
jgi:hypothetical protein